MPLALALLLPLALQSGSPRPRVAVLRSGKRVPCSATTRIGDRSIATPYGSFLTATDPVTGIEDAAQEARLLRQVRELDFPAWLQRVDGRGLVGELLQAADDGTHDDAQQELILERLEDWGRVLDPIPPRLPPDQRVDWVWNRLNADSPGRCALLCGRLLVEIPGASAPSSRRIGLVALRRALRSGEAPRIRTAARVGERQGEHDLVRPLLAVSLSADSAPLRDVAASAAMSLDPQLSLGKWTLGLLRGRKDDERVRAAERLGHSKDPAAIQPLIAAVASARRAPGRFVFFGRQISLVTDFDVQVAQAAAIADPVVNVLTEGTVLEVRIISTTVSRAAMGGLRQLTGANPGPKEEDWLRWYRARKMSD